MCGRYVASTPPQELARIFGTINAVPNLEPTWNMAPTRMGPVVRRHPQTGTRHLDALRWGLIPHWAKDPKAIRQPINARSETAATSPMFRDALRARRCLVPADAFYEWAAEDEGEGTGSRPAKQPWAIARADGKPMAFAGLWEGWRAPDGEAIRTYTLLTTEANAQLRPLHERMTVVLEEADWPLWLGETEDADGAARDGTTEDPSDGTPAWARLLRPSAAEFRVWRVGPAVNSVRNDGEALLQPL